MIVPDHIRSRYLRGKCAALALVLARRQDCALWAMINAADEIEHVFVRHATGKAIDIRGAMDLERIPDGSALAGMEPRLRPASRSEIRAQFGAPARADLREADEMCRRYRFHQHIDTLGAEPDPEP